MKEYTANINLIISNYVLVAITLLCYLAFVMNFQFNIINMIISITSLFVCAFFVCLIEYSVDLKMILGNEQLVFYKGFFITKKHEVRYEDIRNVTAAYLFLKDGSKIAFDNAEDGKKEEFITELKKLIVIDPGAVVNFDRKRKVWGKKILSLPSFIAGIIFIYVFIEYIRVVYRLDLDLTFKIIHYSGLFILFLLLILKHNQFLKFIKTPD